MSTSIHSFRGCHYEPSKGLDVSGIHASRSAANMLHLKPLNLNCTFGRGTQERTEMANRLRGKNQPAEKTTRAEKIALQESGGNEALGWTWRDRGQSDQHR
jgi:hypothetical protein